MPGADGQASGSWGGGLPWSTQERPQRVDPYDAELRFGLLSLEGGGGYKETC